MGIISLLQENGKRGKTEIESEKRDGKKNDKIGNVVAFHIRRDSFCDEFSNSSRDICYDHVGFFLSVWVYFQRISGNNTIDFG